MKCKLCLQEKRLLNCSHIISDFTYQDLYDENHKINKIQDLSNPMKFIRVSSGEYDKGILCEECEQKIGKFENYAAVILFGGNIAKKEMPRFISQVNPHGVEYISIQNIDYRKFKLFLLSLLWRASISKRDYFKHVRLGKYEDEIRKMIYYRKIWGRISTIDK